MKLYGSGRSPYFRKVRAVLAEKGVACEVINAAPSDAAVRAINPLAKIPVLLRADGSGLYDSAVIVEYLDGLGGGPKLIPDAFEDRIEVRRWEALADGIMDAAVLIGREDRAPEAQRRGGEFREKHRAKIVSGLSAFDTALQGREHLWGEEVTLADIACACSVEYAERIVPDPGWRGRHPALAAHFARISARPSFHQS